MEQIKEIGRNESTETQSQIQSVQFSRLTSMGTDGIKGEGRRNLDLILDISVPVSVELGYTNMLIKRYSGLITGLYSGIRQSSWDTCRSVRSGNC